MGLAIGKTISNDLESFAHGIEMIEPLLQTEIEKIVGNQFVSQEAAYHKADKAIQEIVDLLAAA